MIGKSAQANHQPANSRVSPGYCLAKRLRMRESDAGFCAECPPGCRPAPGPPASGQGEQGGSAAAPGGCAAASTDKGHQARGTLSLPEKPVRDLAARRGSLHRQGQPIGHRCRLPHHHQHRPARERIKAAGQSQRQHHQGTTALSPPRPIQEPLLPRRTTVRRTERPPK